jgi:hypothetical protein
VFSSLVLWALGHILSKTCLPWSACLLPGHLQVIILSTRSVRVRRFEAHSWQRYAEVLITAVLAGLFCE